MKYLITLAAIFMGSVACVHAYPIAPRPLRLLVKESQHIIVGYVTNVQDGFIRSDKIENGKLISSTGFGPEMATIKVLENLQGVITADSIKVESYVNMICPEPARYQKQTWVIAFLDKDEDGRYSTHALSCGLKTLNQQDIAIYKKRIREMQQILTINDEEIQFTETIEWLVKCTESETTRLEGFAELNSGQGYVWLYPDGKKRDLSTLVSTNQAAGLKPLLINDRTGINWGIADLLYSTYPSEVESCLIENLNTVNKTNYLSIAESVPRLKSLHHLPEVKQLVKEYNLLSFDERKEKCGEWIKKFIAVYEMSKK